jgi:hypothetical protein
VKTVHSFMTIRGYPKQIAAVLLFVYLMTYPPKVM